MKVVDSKQRGITLKEKGMILEGDVVEKLRDAYDFYSIFAVSDEEFTEYFLSYCYGYIISGKITHERMPELVRAAIGGTVAKKFKEKYGYGS